MCLIYVLCNFNFTRGLDGIPPLVELLHSDYPEVQKNACGALKNLSYGRGPAGTDNKVRTSKIDPYFSVEDTLGCNDHIRNVTIVDLM